MRVRLLALISLLTSNCAAQSDSAFGRKHYPIKSCRIVLRFINAPAFPDSFQFSAIQHNLIITVEGQHYIVDLDRHTGEKGPILLMGGSFEENRKQMGFAFIRIDTLLGKPCKVWEQAL